MKREFLHGFLIFQADWKTQWGYKTHWFVLFLPNLAVFVLLFHIARQVNILLLFQLFHNFRFSLSTLVDFAVLIIWSIWSHTAFDRPDVQLYGLAPFVCRADRVTGSRSPRCALHPRWRETQGIPMVQQTVLCLLVTVWLQRADTCCFSQGLLVAKNRSPPKLNETEKDLEM